MQHELGIAVGELPALEHQVERALKGDTVFEIGRHVVILGIAFVLAVDDFSHLFEHLAHLLLRGDAMMQPVGDMLA